MLLFVVCSPKTLSIPENAVYTESNVLFTVCTQVTHLEKIIKQKKCHVELHFHVSPSIIHQDFRVIEFRSSNPPDLNQVTLIQEFR